MGVNADSGGTSDLGWPLFRQRVTIEFVYGVESADKHVDIEPHFGAFMHHGLQEEAGPDINVGYFAIDWHDREELVPKS